MSDEKIRELERELLRSGRTLEEWALDVLRVRGPSAALLPIYFEARCPKPAPDTRGEVAARAIANPAGAWVVTVAHWIFNGPSDRPHLSRIIEGYDPGAGRVLSVPGIAVRLPPSGSGP